MKIFMLVKRLSYSGAYKMFLWVATSLANRGHEVVIMTFMHSDINEVPDNIRWINRDDLRNKNFFLKVCAIRKVIHNLEPDISISFLLDANVYNILACLGKNTKSIVCERNDPFKPGYKVLKFWKPLFYWANGAVYQLPKVAEFYSNIKRNVVVIPNPVKKTDVQILPLEKRKNIIITLGRLDLFQKRQDILIKAFEKFCISFPDYELHIYGDGPDKEKIKNIIKEKGLDYCVFLKGVTKSPLEVCKYAKIFVLTSDFEGIPNALVEAMSIGLPCISTDCSPGGARLLIEDGKNGFIVPVEGVNDLANKMIYLASNEKLAASIGYNAIEIVNVFSEEKIIKMWENYLCTLK